MNDLDKYMALAMAAGIVSLLLALIVCIVFGN